MSERPRVLIEEWLPVKALGIESRREAAPIPGQFPKLKTLHVWWARRPLAASAGAVLGSLIPAWTAELASLHPNREELASRSAYQDWFLRLCGIWGDPVAAKAASDHAQASGERLTKNPFDYRQAFRNSPTTSDLHLLHSVLTHTWQELPSSLDPTAGGGSIPFEAIRYGIPNTANDLNPVAAAVLRAAVATPASYGIGLTEDLEYWGRRLTDRVQDKMEPFFPTRSADEPVLNYMHARAISCPRTGKPVPLAPNWWLSKHKGGVAVRLVTERDGRQLDEPEFEVVEGKAIEFDPDQGTVARGTGVSPWDGLAIDGEYIKAEAQAGRMGSILYAVATRVNGKRSFRAPADTDVRALVAAEERLAEVLQAWEAEGILPSERVPEGNDSRPHQFGMPRWRDLFSPRQLLVHGTFVEEFRRLMPEVREAVEDRERADAILACLP